MKRLHIELLVVAIAAHAAFFFWKVTSADPLPRGANTVTVPRPPAADPPRRYSDVSAAMVARSDGAETSLLLRHTQVDAEVVGVVSTVRVHQVFVHEGPRPVEATYLFPLPQGAAVHAMTMQVGQRRIVAQIQRRAEARSTYEAARAQGQTAALLEQQRPNVFSWDVANVQPGDTIDVMLDYAQELTPVDGRYEWAFPMTVGPRYGGDRSGATTVAAPVVTRSGRDVGVTLALHTGVPLRGLTSVTHAAQVTQGATGDGRVVLAASDAIPNRDMVVRWELAGERPRATLLARDEAIGGGHFLLMVQPRAAMSLADTAPREYVFVVDVSGSMMGVPLSRAKELMRRCLTSVRPGDRFQIIRFASGNDTFAPAPVATTREQVTRALAWVDGTEAGGGTEFLPALETAFAQPRTPGLARVVVFLTDGYIGYEDGVLAWLHAHAAGANLFSVGVGSSVNRHLIDGMARVGRGEPFVLLNDDPVEATVDRLFATISRPALTDVTLHWDGVTVRDVTPARVPDLFADRPIVLTGRYEQPGTGTLTLRGMLAGSPYEETLPVDLRSGGGDASHPALSFLWARRRIDDLMDEHTFAAPEARPPIEERVTELALDHHLMSAFTSFVAVDTRVRGPAAAERAEVPQVLPQGVSPAMAEAPVAQPAIALSRDQVAPGDPEIAVQAPAGTRAVVARLPHGEALPLAYDARREVWVGNFVVPHDAPDGVYTVRVTLTLADGSSLERTARYEVDGAPPEVVATLEGEAVAGGTMLLRVRPAHERAPTPPVDFTDVGSGSFSARVRREVERVEALLPDGSVARAEPEADGSFTLRFRVPAGAGARAVDVVALDAAGNATRRVLSFPVRAE